jgi:hypothetical protein
MIAGLLRRFFCPGATMTNGGTMTVEVLGTGDMGSALGAAAGRE